MGSEGRSHPAARRPAGGLRKGDRRRQAILEAVEQLLTEQPITAVSVEDIALAAGISRSGFYFYFESKYAALAECMTMAVAEALETSRALMGPGDESPVPHVADALREAIGVWDRHEPLMVAMVEASLADPGARRMTEAIRAPVVAAIAQRIEQERAAGRAPDGPSPAALGRALTLLCERVLYDASRTGGSPTDATQTLTHLWLSSIWGKSAVA